MTADRNAALTEIAALAERHGISADEIAQRLAAARTPGREGGIAKAVMGYTGGAFVFAGLALLASMLWPDIGPAQRVVITLGPGLVAFVLGLIAHRDPRFDKGVTPLFLVGAFLQPTGLFVFLDEFVPPTGDPVLAVVIVFATLAVQHGLAYMQTGRASLYFLALAFYLGFVGTTLDWLEADGELNAIVLGLGAMCLARFAEARGHRAIAPFWYFVGGGCLLGGVFGAVEGGPAEVVYLGVNGFLVYLSLRLASRSLLALAVFGLIGYLSSFTYEYFADAIGWPVAMIVIGLAMIGLSAYAVRLGRGIGTGKG